MEEISDSIHRRRWFNACNGAFHSTVRLTLYRFAVTVVAIQFTALGRSRDSHTTMGNNSDLQATEYLSLWNDLRSFRWSCFSEFVSRGGIGLGHHCDNFLVSEWNCLRISIRLVLILQLLFSGICGAFSVPIQWIPRPMCVCLRKRRWPMKLSVYIIYTQPWTIERYRATKRQYTFIFPELIVSHVEPSNAVY